MDISWLVRWYSYILRRNDPTDKDVDFANLTVWINTKTNKAFILNDGWQDKSPDKIIKSGSRHIYVIDAAADIKIQDTKSERKITIEVISAPSFNRYTDAEAVAAVNSDTDHGETTPHDFGIIT
jgi:hypothetical protein